MGVDADGQGFAESKLGSVKNARTADLVKVEKVAVGFALGLNGTPWVREWITLRGKLGLNARRDGCLLRAPRGDGTFMKRRLRSGEFLGWLRKKVGGVGVMPNTKQQYIGTHSSKGTLLS